MDDKQSVNLLVFSIGKDTLFYIPSRLFPAIFGFVSLLLYSRIFPPAEYGDYSMVLATITIAGIFSYTWISEGSLRFYSSYKNSGRLEDFLSTTFLTVIGLLVVISLLLLILLWTALLPSSIIEFFSLTIALIAVTSVYEVMLTILRSDRNPKAISVFRSVSTAGSLAVSLILIYFFGFRVSALLLGIILTNGIQSIFILFKYDFFRHIRMKNFSAKTLVTLGGFGIPMIVATLFYSVLGTSDRYIIEFFRGSYEVGVYSAAYQLGDYPVTLFYSLVSLAAYPILIDAWEKNGDSLTKNLIQKITKYYLLIAIPAFIGTTICSSAIMGVLDVSYSEGYLIIPWICFGGLVFNLSDCINKGIALKNKTRNLAVLAGISAIANVLLNLLLVPPLGFYGAAIASCLAFLLYFGLSILISKRYLEWRIPFDSLKNICISSLAMGIVILMIKSYIGDTIIDVVLLAIMGIIVYSAAILVTGEVTEEISLLKEHRFFIKNA